MTKNKIARALGIPKWLRQHAARHGVSVETIEQTHRKFPVQKLDQWRDKENIVRKMFDLSTSDWSLWEQESKP